jgi:hypothetical protein
MQLSSIDTECAFSRYYSDYLSPALIVFLDMSRTMDRRIDIASPRSIHSHESDLEKRTIHRKILGCARQTPKIVCLLLVTDG